MSELPTNNAARNWLDSVRDQIINQELPIELRYMLDLVRVGIEHNDRIQIEATSMGQVLIDLARFTYRLINLVGQLVGQEKLMELLRKCKQ